MRADSIEIAIRAANWAGIELTAKQKELLVRFHDWLGNEAIVAGGIGPHEADRIWSRHIGDSLVFGGELHGRDSCLDIGSGVGLPGIALAIAFPEIPFDLLDRSGRRCDLMRRALAVLRIGNCSVVCADISQVEKKYSVVVSRAAIPPERILIHVKHRLEPKGVALLALSRTETAANQAPTLPGLDASVVAVPSDILDTDAHLLRIEAT